MKFIAGIVGCIIIFIVMWDAFETIVLPRRVTRNVRLTRLFYHLTWIPWSSAARRLKPGNKREMMVGYYGPASLIMLLIFWAVSLIVGFALLQWAVGSQLTTPREKVTFLTDLYLSVDAFFTVGLGDIVPIAAGSRFLAALEGGLGFGFLALVISYLPALNSAFSRREINVSMLDERAGSPPSAFRLLERSRAWDGPDAMVTQFLKSWEGWAAELMESHLSYPVLAYFRSQHENQSWVSALTMVLDLSALVLVGVDDIPMEPARLTFAMARHAAVDLTQVFNTPPRPPVCDRLPPETLAQMRAGLAQIGVVVRTGAEADRQLKELRELYEPYMNAMAELLLVNLPPWMPEPKQLDNWQTTAWEH